MNYIFDFNRQMAALLRECLLATNGDQWRKISGLNGPHGRIEDFIIIIIIIIRAFNR